MQMLTVVLALVLCVAQTWADNDLPGCNKNILDSISAYWKKNGVPKDILKTLAKEGKGTLLYSTEKVPVKVPVAKPKCVNGEFTPTTAKFTVVPSKGAFDAAKTTVSYAVTEKDGTVSEDNGKILKVIISNKDGVTSFYTCNPKGDPEAEPAAGVAVAIKKYKSSQKGIVAAKKVLKDLGFGLETKYPNQCVK